MVTITQEYWDSLTDAQRQNVIDITKQPISIYIYPKKGETMAAKNGSVRTAIAAVLVLFVCLALVVVLFLWISAWQGQPTRSHQGSMSTYHAVPIANCFHDHRL